MYKSLLHSFPIWVDETYFFFINYSYFAVYIVPEQLKCCWEAKVWVWMLFPSYKISVSLTAEDGARTHKGRQTENTCGLSETYFAQ